MLYVFGDSMSCGSKFYLDGMSDEESRKRSWPQLLAKRLGEELVDHTYPATGNWRIARLLQSIDLKPEDIVIIQWSNNYRFEMGVSDDAEYQGIEKQDFRLNDYMDCFQQEDGYRTKAMCRSLLSKTSDPRSKHFMGMAFETFFNYKWFDEMFKVMFTSCCYKLDKVGCNYIMFDGWIPTCESSDFKDVKQYAFKGRTIGNIVRRVLGNQLPDKSYPNDMENSFVAELLEKKYKEMYCNQNEDESVYIPELERKYYGEN